jgi:hypothetical protein
MAMNQGLVGFNILAAWTALSLFLYLDTGHGSVFFMFSPDNSSE